ncbi:MAG: hypothetical protein DRQ37_06025 [Gammaproteobacteria bacterium]|nr:MAG: hypothetical protein DRQ37_06025 [Gammaproteobacteria bacterium]
MVSLAFACYLKVPKETIYAIGLGALLHDVGKMQIPLEILDKPGRLSDDEFDIVRHHPVRGYEMVADSGPDVPRASLDVVRNHHERQKGHGYPDAVSGTAFPQHVKIAAAADVYDALTSQRAYRRALTPHDSLRLMYKTGARDFGAHITENFIRCLGIYPVGSAVKLVNGYVGVITSVSKSAVLKPVVLLLLKSDGIQVLPRRYLNLATIRPGDSAKGWAIESVTDAVEHNIDVGSILADEIALH